MLYLHRISDARVGGRSGRHMNMFKEICGTDSLKNVVYVTNMWSEPPTRQERQREVELRDEFFDVPMIDGAQMARHTNTRASALNVIRLVLDRTPVTPNLSRQLVDQGMKLEETNAGKRLGGDLQNAVREFQEKIKSIRAALETASKANDQKWKARLERQERQAKERRQQLLDQITCLKQGHAMDQRGWLKDSQEGLSEMMNRLREQFDQRVEQVTREHQASMRRAAEQERERMHRMAEAHRQALREELRKAEERETRRLREMAKAHTKQLNQAAERERQLNWQLSELRRQGQAPNDELPTRYKASAASDRASPRVPANGRENSNSGHGAGPSFFGLFRNRSKD